jgi:TetR/AcrR family transcriptional repressor of mexCD-oprJ operon
MIGAVATPKPETVDHRRAIADRNCAAILDAATRLLGERATLTMAAIAAEAGVSRVTLYAHFKSLGDVVEALVARAIAASLAVVEEARPEEGPADLALHRVVEASWSMLGSQQAIAGAVAEHLPPDQVRRSHAPLMERLRPLLERGQRDAVFRSDLPADWLVTMYFALVHAADEHARAHRLARARALEMLKLSISDLFIRP